MKSETHGPLERIVLSAPVHVPGESTQGTADASVYLIDDLLIDAGPRRFAAALVDALAATPPKRILLTHQHEDHAGAVARLRHAFGDIAVFAPQPLVPLLANPEPIGAYRVSYWGEPEPIPDAIAVDEGQILEAGGLRIAAIATPGHTPGHMSYLAEVGDSVYAFTGDLFVNTGPYLAFFESSADDLIMSLRRIAAFGDMLYVLPAHGRARPKGAATLLKQAEWLEKESATIRKASARLGTTEPFAVALELYGKPEAGELATGGEFSTAALVRSVLAPPRSYPVERINLSYTNPGQMP